jgi:hypothetical protein
MSTEPRPPRSRLARVTAHLRECDLVPTCCETCSNRGPDTVFDRATAIGQLIRIGAGRRALSYRDNAPVVAALMVGRASIDCHHSGCRQRARRVVWRAGAYEPACEPHAAEQDARNER